MKSFRSFIKEEVLPSVQVADGGLDISKPAVRAAINAAIAGVVSQPAVTPYVVFNRLSKLLAQYHIVLPKKFLEGDKGVEVFEIKQFGHKMGMTDSGEFVSEVPSTHYLFLQYGIITPLGITYAKPIVGGMFRVTARLVDKAELDRLLNVAEITMAEEAECRQMAAKAMAPKEPMHDITSDEKKKGNKAAVADSQKGLDEEKDGPCWKGYEMVGMKKKRGREVPNCVPTNEEQLDEIGFSNRFSPLKKTNPDSGYVNLGHKKGYGYSSSNPDMRINRRAGLDKHVGWDDDAQGEHDKQQRQMSKFKEKAKSRLKEENLEELSRTTLRKYKAKAIDYVGQAMDGKKGKEGISKLDNRVGGIEAANKRLGVKYEETQIDEKLTKKMSAADVIHDFVHSDDPKFAGKSTKERQKMALGAYYGMHPEKSRKD